MTIEYVIVTKLKALNILIAITRTVQLLRFDWSYFLYYNSYRPRPRLEMKIIAGKDQSSAFYSGNRRSTGPFDLRSYRLIPVC
jgi:hypothetical protein